MSNSKHSGIISGSLAGVLGAVVGLAPYVTLHLMESDQQVQAQGYEEVSHYQDHNPNREEILAQGASQKEMVPGIQQVQEKDPIDNIFINEAQFVKNTAPLYEKVAAREPDPQVEKFDPEGRQRALQDLGLAEEDLHFPGGNDALVDQLKKRDIVDSPTPPKKPVYYRFRGGSVANDQISEFSYSFSAMPVFTPQDFIGKDGLVIPAETVMKIFQDPAAYMLDISQTGDPEIYPAILARQVATPNFEKPGEVTLGQFLKDAKSSQNLDQARIALMVQSRREYIREKYAIEAISASEKNAVISNIALIDIARNSKADQLDGSTSLSTVIDDFAKKYQDMDEDIALSRVQGGPTVSNAPGGSTQGEDEPIRYNLKDQSAKYFVRVANQDTPSSPYILRGYMSRMTDSFDKRVVDSLLLDDPDYKLIASILGIPAGGILIVMLFLVTREILKNRRVEDDDPFDREGQRAQRKAEIRALQDRLAEERETAQSRREEEKRIAKTFEAAKQRYNVIASEYTKFETQPQYLLTHPSIRDVTVPATAHFIEVFNNCWNLIDEAERYNDREKIAQLSDEVKKLETAWDEAVRNAEQIVESGLSKAQRRRMQRLMDRILNPTNENEQRLDIQALRDILDSIAYLDEFNITRTLNGEEIMQKTTTALQGGGGFAQIER